MERIQITKSVCQKNATSWLERNFQILEMHSEASPPLDALVVAAVNLHFDCHCSNKSQFFN